MSPAPRNERMPSRIELPRNDQTLLSTLIFNPARWLTRQVGNVGEGVVSAAEWVTNKIWRFVTHPLVLLPALTAGGIVLGRNRGWWGTDPNNILNRAAGGVDTAAGFVGEQAARVPGLVGQGVDLAGQGLNNGYNWISEQASPLTGPVSEGASNFWSYIRNYVSGADVPANQRP